MVRDVGLADIEPREGPTASRHERGFRPIPMARWILGEVLKAMTKNERHEYLGAVVHQSLIQQIKEMRLARSLTQDAFGELIGMSASDVSRLEAGRHMPTIRTLLEIAKALDVALLIRFVSWSEWANQYSGVWITPMGFVLDALASPQLSQREG